LFYELASKAELIPHVSRLSFLEIPS